MKKLFVCCDGTWNSPVTRKYGVLVPTNVRKFYNCIAPIARDEQGSDITQLRYYHPGVGTNEGLLRRMWDGATGAGLSENILSAYKWLADHYEPGDQIYLLGFSRGAFTVRSLSGLLRHCGLPHQPDWKLVQEAFDLYRANRNDPAADSRCKDFRNKHNVDPKLSIHFLGVWDTVGALGIPRRFDWLSIGFKRNRFHDTSLSPLVKNAIHALAIDEMRSSFAPTLWTSDSEPGQTLKQVWFCGVHADVGGGYKEAGLSNITLCWMIDEAQNVGAAFESDLVAQIVPDFRGVKHDSLDGFFKFTGSQPRSIPSLNATGSAARFGQSIHSSVLNRQTKPPIEDAPYREPRLLSPGGFVDVPVYARDYWNATGVFLEAGATYRFESLSGRAWLDWYVASGADGYRGSILQNLLAHWKRVPKANWFALCGAVADAVVPTVSGDPPPISTFVIDQNKPHKPQQSGHLFMFANDLPLAYFNNRGSLLVRISRLA